MIGFLKILLFSLVINNALHAQSSNFPWLNSSLEKNYISISNINLPKNFKRVSLKQKSFAYWLRSLPLKKNDQPVLLYNGHLKSNQQAHYRILNIDVGNKDLQQCADAVIRLRAEYLYFRGQKNNIVFNFTSGHQARYQDWENGYRPIVKNNRVRWQLKASRDASYTNFRKYLETVFMYAGSYSLTKELAKINHSAKIKIGDVLIQGGFPGHAVMVVDMAKNVSNGDKIILLAQSYMPAQEIHILKNPLNAGLNPWYLVKSSGSLITPEWQFQWKDFRRFTNSELDK